MPLRKKIDKNRIILLKNIYKIKNPNQFFIFLQKVYHTEKFLTIFALPCRPGPSIAPAKPAPLRVAMSDLPLPLHSATRRCPKKLVSPLLPNAFGGSPSAHGNIRRKNHPRPTKKAPPPKQRGSPHLFTKKTTAQQTKRRHQHFPESASANQQPHLECKSRLV